MTRLEQIKARIEKATKAPWSREGQWVHFSDDEASLYFHKRIIGKADFIANSRQDTPWLVEVVEKQRDAIKKYRSECQPHPCPDFALRAQYRKELFEALELTEGP